LLPRTLSLRRSSIAPARTSDRHDPSRRDTACRRALTRTQSRRAAPDTRARVRRKFLRIFPQAAPVSRSRRERTHRRRARRCAPRKRPAAAFSATAVLHRVQALRR
ncbi:unnamed protein product, partial [Ectocarpus sp. 12 AP-2014]